MKYELLNKNEEIILKRKQKNDIRNKFCICLSNSRYEAIRRVSRKLGYKLVKESELWNICWTDSVATVEFCKDMRRFQKINHFPGMYEICRKDLLARNLNRMLKMYPLDYQIFPKTWCFPADLGEAIAYSKSHRNKTFIIKPDQGAQGKGIWLTKNLKEIKPTDRMICQLYINKPLLIDGFKFDLRVYALMTSTDPLRIFVYHEGLARFATKKYKEPHMHNVSNMFMHLTNYSVNKHSRTYSVDNEYGTKRKFSTINKILGQEGYNVDELWANIDDIIVKTILSAYPMLKHNYSACFPSHDRIQACFEILGIDILIDNKLKPYILEVNHSPSFHTDEPIDREVKDALLTDTFNLLYISLSDKKRILEEDKKRVKTRLLQKIHNHDRENRISDSNITSETNNQVKDTSQIWEKQILWEESHMGGFRQVMPPKYGDLNKYSQFHLLHNQATIYGDTAASKRREECSKEQRKKLANKLIQDQLLMSRNNRKYLQAIGEESGEGGKKRKKKLIKINDGYLHDNISDNEERDRLHGLQQRELLVQNSGLAKIIFLNFFKENLLTSSDKKKYNELFTTLTNAGKNEEEKEKNIPNYRFISMFSTYTGTDKKPKNELNPTNRCNCFEISLQKIIH